MAEDLVAMECSVHELKELMRSGGINLIDVREYAEVAGGRVIGSHHIPLGDLETRLAEIARDRATYFICRSGKRGLQAQNKLLSLGFSNVRNVKGGFDAWKKAGFDFEKDAKAVWSLERQVRFAAGLLVVIGVVLSWLLHPYIIALSAFVGVGLVFAAVTDTCTMAMILAKMPWNKNSGVTCETVIQKA